MLKYFSLFIFLIALSHPELASGFVGVFSNFDDGMPQKPLTFSTPHYFSSSTDQRINLTTFNSSAHQVLSKDSLKTKDTVYTHKWRTATIWSACLPGAGQIYNEIGYRRVADKKNRAWWKAPIIYGALGVTGYFFYQNTITARALKAEWLFREANPGQLLYEEYYDWDQTQLLNGKNLGLYVEPGFDIAAKRRDLFAFGFIAIWGLQVVEALVDGHFVHFDVSQDLSFSWTPTMLDYSTPGVALKLQFD